MNSIKVNNNYEGKNEHCSVTSIQNLDIFGKTRFPDLISRLFDMYKNYPNKKIGSIIKNTFSDYINVINFIKESILNNSKGDYDQLLKNIGEKFGEKIKILSDTDELKQYFVTYNDSAILFSAGENDAKIILQLLGIDTSYLEGDIDVIFEEGILCFACNDTDFALLYGIEEGEEIPNGCLFKYKKNHLPIILLRKDNPQIEGTKSHEIQHHINNTLFNKNIEIDGKNITRVIDDRFKDEIIAQAIHGTPVMHFDGKISDESISYYMSNTYYSHPYDFTFRVLHKLISNTLKKHGKEFNGDMVTNLIKTNQTLRNQYSMLRDNIYRKKFDLRDCSNFARDMIKNIENGNLILALTPFNDREGLREIYEDDIILE